MSKRGQTSGLPKAGASKSPASTSTSKSTGTAPKVSAASGAKAGKPLREYRSRAEREAEIQRYVILGTAIAVGVVVVIVAVALFIDVFITPNQAVAQVNDTTITVGEFQRRVRLERALINERLNDVLDEASIFGDQSQQYLQLRLGQEPFRSWTNEIEVSDVLGNRVLNDMVEDQLVRERAEALGVTVTEEDIQQAINLFFEYDPVTEPEPVAGAESTEVPEPTGTPTPFVSPTPSPAPTVTPTPEVTPTASVTPVATVSPVPTLNPTERAEQFMTRIDETFARVRSSAGVSQEEIDRFFELRALRVAVAEAELGDQIPDTQPEVRLRHILVATEEEAQDVLAALNAGESFADLARAVSTDTGSAARGGEYGWAPLGNYVEPFAEAAETAEIGAFTEPVQTEFGYHVIQVLGRRPVPMSEAQRRQELEEAFETYLSDLRTAEGTSIETFSIWANNVPVEPIFRPRQ